MKHVLGSIIATTFLATALQAHAGEGIVTDLPMPGSETVISNSASNNNSTPKTTSQHSKKNNSSKGSDVKVSETKTTSTAPKKLTPQERYAQYSRIYQIEGNQADSDKAFTLIESQTLLGVKEGVDLYLDLLANVGGSGNTATAISYMEFILSESRTASAVIEVKATLLSLLNTEGSTADAVSDFNVIKKSTLAKRYGLTYAKDEFLYLMAQIGGSSNTTAAQSLFQALEAKADQSGIKYVKVRDTYLQLLNVEGSTSDASADLDVVMQGARVSGSVDESLAFFLKVLSDSGGSGNTATAIATFKRFYLNQ